MFGRKKRPVSDFDSEIKAHLDLATEQFREKGLDKAEARYAALRQFGNVTIARERFYEAGRWRWLQSIGTELRRALINLAKTPRFTIPAILTLALGLGGALTFYAAFHAVFLRTPSFPGAHRIYRLVTHTKEYSGKWPAIGYALKMKEAASDVESLGVLGLRVQSYLAPGNGSPIPVQSQALNDGMQRLSGLRFSLGGGFQKENFQSGRGILLSHQFWKNHFGGDASVLGRLLTLNNAPHPIQGVLAENAEIPLSAGADLYTPYKTLSPREMESTTATILIRLREGATPESVLPQFEAAARLLAPKPEWIQHPGLQSLRKSIAEDADVRFFVVCGAAALFLLLATANVAGLFLARASEKNWETSVRLCLGTPGSALFRKFLLEGLCVAIPSAVLAFWLNAILANSLRAWIPGGESLPGLDGAWNHLAVALFGLALVLLITLLFGMVPMLQLRRLDLSRAVQEGPRTQSVRTKGRTALVIAQMTLATLMLCITALLGQSLWAMSHRATGVQPENLAMTQLLYEQSPKQGQGWRNTALLSALRSQPRIQAAAVTSGLGGVSGMSILGSGTQNLRIARHAIPQKHRMLQLAALSDQAFQTLGIALIQGREFTAADVQRRVCIITRETERMAGLAPGKAVGQALYGCGEPLEIIGVASSFNLFPDYTVQDGLIVFRPAMPAPPDALFVRSTLSKKDLEASILSAMRETSPGMKPGSTLVVSELYGEKSLPHRQITGLLAVFGGISIVLATLGLFALLSDCISRRQRELGIRAALGAASILLMGSVLFQGLWRTGIGVGLGLVAAILAGSYMQNLLYGIPAHDPQTLAAVGSLLLCLGFLSSLIPALGAASIDPAKALREG